ncbi:hypothetical protein K438DRAFT_1778499 [Mycena galopus ATCC 62051]|nr:hypothetical protein K438DRAFT_1778499 [Mycena galopus ATCC 62051]
MIASIEVIPDEVRVIRTQPGEKKNPAGGYRASALRTSTGEDDILGVGKGTIVRLDGVGHANIGGEEAKDIMALRLIGQRTESEMKAEEWSGAWIVLPYICIPIDSRTRNDGGLGSESSRDLKAACLRPTGKTSNIWGKRSGTILSNKRVYLGDWVLGVEPGSLGARVRFFQTRKKVWCRRCLVLVLGVRYVAMGDLERMMHT